MPLNSQNMRLEMCFGTNNHTLGTCFFHRSVVRLDVIYQTQDTTVFHHISNTEKRVENMTCGRVFLMNFKVFDIVMKRCDECLI